MADHDPSQSPDILPPHIILARDDATVQAFQQLDPLLRSLLLFAHSIAQKDEHLPLTMLFSKAGAKPLTGNFAAGETKYQYADRIRATARKMGAHTAVFINEAWLTVFKTDKDIKLVDTEAILAAAQKARASGTGRIEALIITVERLKAAPLVFRADVGAEGGCGTRKLSPLCVLGNTQSGGDMMDLLGELGTGEEV